jgi:PHD/YefM family antitoxin component YafN of YafNO toxin-antitoxin module
MEKLHEILELPEDVRRLVGECEVSGKRTTFARNGRPIAILMSHDEYLALRETVEISGKPEVQAALDAAEYEVKRNALLAIEDLLENERQKDEG